MNYYIKIKKRVAFTLAEVLITLAIIGVIAAITIPNLLQSYEKQQTISGLQSAYALLSNAIKMAVAENGDIDNWDYLDTPENFNKKYIIPYLKVTKTCNNADCITTDGFHGYYDLNMKKYTNIQYSYILNNGMIVMYDRQVGTPTTVNTHWHVFIVDINGSKGKNRMGRDIFAFYLLNHTFYYQLSRFEVYPSGLYIGSLGAAGIPHVELSRDEIMTEDRGCKLGNSYGDTGHAGAGSACAALIFKDGWKISKDYPW